MKILFVTTEAEPFAVVGGLGVVMRALPAALRDLEADARIFIPRYLKVDNEKWNLKVIYEGLKVPTENQKGPKEIICNVKFHDPSAQKSEAPVPTYFLENMEYYEQRANVYGYADDVVRWMLLCRGALEFLRVSAWVPDVIVCTDWHCGLLANIHRNFYADDPVISKIPVVLSIHSLASQMSGAQPRFIAEGDADDGHTLLPAFEDPLLLKVNGMKRGIINADIINTVSSTYAKEITTPEYGQGLDPLLRKKSEQKRLEGIINGLDYAYWNPESDEVIEHHFSRNDSGPRAQNKAVLQKFFELPEREDVFVIGIVSRMVIQKGIDLLESITPALLQDLRIQLIAVGEGDPRIMDILLNLQKLFPQSVAAKFSYQAKLPRLIYAGADVVLIPSRFEPSGLTQ
ncbi:MAG: glycogen/starch synthase, partial [bacterium]|nr:glycogen/starch synthase [bacterium]